MATRKHGHRDTQSQRHTVTGTYGHRDTESQGHTATETHGHRDTQPQGHAHLGQAEQLMCYFPCPKGTLSGIHSWGGGLCGPGDQPQPLEARRGGWGQCGLLTPQVPPQMSLLLKGFTDPHPGPLLCHCCNSSSVPSLSLLCPCLCPNRGQGHVCGLRPAGPSWLPVRLLPQDMAPGVGRRQVRDRASRPAAGGEPCRVSHLERDGDPGPPGTGATRMLHDRSRQWEEGANPRNFWNQACKLCSQVASRPTSHIRTELPGPRHESHVDPWR